MPNFLGMSYPIVSTPKGYLPSISGLSTIKSDLLILLLTRPGERCMMTSYGTPLNNLIYEQNDLIIEDQAKQMISDAITQWEPRIKINSISVNSSVDSSFLSPNDDLTEQTHVLGITISFTDPQNITQIEELILQVPLQN